MFQTATGEWFGHYINRNSFSTSGGHRFEIMAMFAQKGNSLTGSMTDLDDIQAISVESLSKMPAALEWTKSQRAAFNAFELRYPDAHIKSTLPRLSNLKGQIGGDLVRFEKTYLGVQTTVWTDDDRVLGTKSSAPPSVTYQGHLSADGQQILGIWTIRRPGIAGVFGKELGSGEFVLIRHNPEVVR